MTPRTPEDLLATLLDAHPQAIDASRADAALWSELRARGYGMQGDERLALERDDWFHPGRFETARHGGLGARLFTWADTDSTNERAHEHDAQDDTRGCVWITEQQSAGRGRQGRSWMAVPFSSLLFSVHLPVQLQESPVPQLLPLALGIGLCEALRQASGRAVQVRWPNDLLLDDAKVGGMLLEVRGGRCIVGIGVNLWTPRAALRDLGLPQATSLFDAAGLLEREALLADVLAHIERHMLAWERGETAGVLDAWRRLDCLSGRRVRVQTADREQQGVVRGVDVRGLLELEDDAGTVHRYTAAEVHIL